MIQINDRAQEHTKKCFLPNKNNHEYIIQIICAGITYIISNTQVYDSVMADVMKKIATQKKDKIYQH